MQEPEEDPEVTGTGVSGGWELQFECWKLKLGSPVRAVFALMIDPSLQNQKLWTLKKSQSFNFLVTTSKVLTQIIGGRIYG